jgi:hypothetical protein
VAEAIVDVLHRADVPPPTERVNAEPGVGGHARKVLRKQIEGLSLGAGARMRVDELVRTKIFVPRERLASHDPDLTRLSALGWTSGPGASTNETKT